MYRTSVSVVGELHDLNVGVLHRLPRSRLPGEFVDGAVFAHEHAEGHRHAPVLFVILVVLHHHPVLEHSVLEQPLGVRILGIRTTTRC